jgi:hypothetical protein
MGVELSVGFAGDVPEFGAIRAQLARVCAVPPLRMIDGLPAFPDETPEAGWRELRFGFAAGMVTLRRAPGALSCVVWGTADAALLAARDALAWACAEAGGGAVRTGAGELSAAEFARAHALQPA